DVLLNQGDGTLAAPARNFIDAEPANLVLADIDGDGSNDLVALTGTGLAILLNQGHGTFATAKTLALPPTAPQRIFPGDLNGGGRGDLGVVSSSSPVNHNLAVLLNHGGGNFGPVTTYPAGGFLMSVAGADLNGDGGRDLVVVDSYSNIGVLMNHG